jgi:hypothetical protein
MKIVVLLFVLVAAFCFAMKKTIDSRVLLAERLQAERTIVIEKAAVGAPQRLAVL